MSTAIDGLLFAWKKNLEYGQKLVADLSDEQMAKQPAPGTNHPAWVLSHLNAYLPVIEYVIKGESFDDPKDHPFGMQSKPVADRSVYASKDELVAAFVTGHERVEKALREAGDAVWAKPVSLPRWQKPMPTAAIALPYLMLVHENTHFGQVSAWRRVQGLPSV
ncbi:MAG: DinB family protein [Phycisphaerales bacterium]